MKTFRNMSFVRKFARRLNNLHERADWVKEKVSELPDGATLLDAGCGSQQFRKFCEHLDYKA